MKKILILFIFLCISYEAFIERFNANKNLLARKNYNQIYKYAEKGFLQGELSLYISNKTIIHIQEYENIFLFRIDTNKDKFSNFYSLEAINEIGKLYILPLKKLDKIYQIKQPLFGSMYRDSPFKIIPELSKVNKQSNYDYYKNFYYLEKVQLASLPIFQKLKLNLHVNNRTLVFEEFKPLQIDVLKNFLLSEKQ